jgi:hypothetical protein
VRYRYHAVDIEGLGDAERGEVCRLVLRTLEETVHQFEADIPWSDSWPPEVREAAGVLASAAGLRPAAEPYQRTRMMKRADEDVWRAFATFAGHAYDASAWSHTRILPIVSLADAGTAVGVRVNEDERALLEAALRPLGVGLRPDA